MTEIGEPFGFFNPARHGKPSFSTSSCKRTRASLRRTTTSFSPFLQLPFELRIQITRLSIEDAVEFRYQWRRTRGDPVVLQSRRGVFRVQPRRKQPPSLPQLACVSKEWQEEIEKQLFETLSLTVRPDCRSDQCSDLGAFASIVTGPRRRYLGGLQLDLFRKHQTHQLADSNNSNLRHTGSIMRLLRILGTWGREQLADDLLRVELRIELQDLHPLMKEIENLPTIPAIAELDVAVDLTRRSGQGKLPMALLCLIRKLSELRSVDFYFSHWRFLHWSYRNCKIEELMGGLLSAAPQLKELITTLPNNDQQRFYHWRPSNSLTGLPVSSILEISHSLQSLTLDSPIDLALFFKHFHNEVEDVERICSSWPELQYLRIQGSIVKGNDPTSHQEKDWFLKVVGRAARRMPKLQGAKIEIESDPMFMLGVNRMVIHPSLAKSTVSEWFQLELMGHAPSSSAVSVWEDTLQQTNRLELFVRFVPAPYLGEDGERLSGDWQVWEE